MKDLLTKLATEGGCLVSSADCTSEEINNATTRGGIYVDPSGFGYVHRIPAWMQLHDPHCRGGEEFPCVKPDPASRCQWSRGVHSAKVVYLDGGWKGYVWTQGDNTDDIMMEKCADAGEAFAFCSDEIAKRI